MESWNIRCLESIKKEWMEIERRYGIRIGQTELRCAKCGGRWGFGGHDCNIRTDGNKSKNYRPDASCESTGA